tara:strand:+ start:463 stop:588 length:126 start_codon:yes stop_codon:yes gene_type:complete
MKILDGNIEIPLEIFVESLKEIQPYIQEEIDNQILERLNNE